MTCNILVKRAVLLSLLVTTAAIQIVLAGCSSKTQAGTAAKAPDVQQATEAPDSGDMSPPVPLGSAAPDAQLTGLDGKKLMLSSLKGRVVLIDFWATWCPPCRKSLPETNKLHAEFASKGLSVLAVSDEEKGTVAPFIKKAGYTFPTYLDTGDQANKTYKISGIPTVVVIDRKGNLAAYMVGLQSPEQIREELKKAGL